MAERVFHLPDLGEGLEEALVSAWLVAEGDEVTVNQPLVEVETAKAAVEIPSPFAGRIARLHAAAGSTLGVGSPLVTFDVEGVVTPAATEPSAAEGTGTVATSEPVDIGGRAPAGPAATPAVRKLAKDLGVDLALVSGSGAGGRITREDVEAFARSEGRATSAPVAPPSGDVEEIPVSAIRRSIADRLTEVAAIPQVTTFRTVDCTALDALRRDLGVSPLPVFVRALAETLREHRALNASWTERAILVHGKVHAGIATDTEHGLVVPVVRDAGALGIAAIAAEIERLARAAREGSLEPVDVAGATVTVSNTGSYGSEAGTPLLDPGHAVTIALGAISPRAIVVDGHVEARPACTLSCTFDHRAVDGAAVGRALTDLVALLQDPERLAALPR
jgi:2-oxoisovalerate dehydrogenase E2 component (dihydrolipoyl transacylase)